MVYIFANITILVQVNLKTSCGHMILMMREIMITLQVNLIIPCVGISFLSVLVFYLPSDSGEKVDQFRPICQNLTAENVACDINLCAGLKRSLQTNFLGFSLNLYLALAHCVLPAPGRDHPPHLPLRPPPWQGDLGLVHLALVTVTKQYLLFTMILVTFSVVVTIGVLNVNFRTPATHKMAPWVRKIFIDFLPR